jgi:hypothetical protein
LSRVTDSKEISLVKLQLLKKYQCNFHPTIQLNQN